MPLLFKNRVPLGYDDDESLVDSPVTADMVPSARPVPIGPMAPQPEAPKPKAAPIGSTPQPVNPKLEQDKTELARLQNTGSGLSQLNNHPGVGHKIAGVLGRIGDIAGTAMFPSITAQIPGTELHHQLMVNQVQKRINNDLAEQKEEATTRYTNAEAVALEDKGPKDAFHLWLQQNPGGTYEEWQKASSKESPDKVANPQAGYAAAIADAMKRGVDPAKDPHVQAWKSAIEDLAKTTPEKADDKARAIYSKDPKTWSDEERAFIKGYEKQVDVTKTQPGVARMEILNDPKWASLDLQKQRMVSPYVQNAMDSAKIDDLAELIMNDVKKRGGKITGPEFMQLLSYHMAGTIGGIKGMKGGIEMLKEHVNARPWSQSLEAMYNKAVNGGDVSLAQAQEWAQLAKDRRRIFLEQARQANELYGANLDLGKITPTENDTGGGNQDFIYARDPQGNLHKAPAGTQLPQGWKLENKQ